MSKPIETVVTNMRKFMGVYGMNHLSPSFSANRGSIHDEDLNELQSVVHEEISPGTMIEVDPALNAAMNNPPFAWTIYATMQYLMKNYEEFNHKL
jgi:hypothetical protein